MHDVYIIYFPCKQQLCVQLEGDYIINLLGKVSHHFAEVY